MNNLDEMVLSAYKQILLLPQEKITKALVEYWQLLKLTCTQEKPCIECLREMEELEQ